MKVFITGDRMLSPIYPQLVALEMMRALAAGDTVVTGPLEGVEAVVRSFGEQADLGDKVDVLEFEPMNDEGHESRAMELKAAADVRVVAVHCEPMSSHIVKPLVAAFSDADDRLRVVTPADLLLA